MLSDRQRRRRGRIRVGGVNPLAIHGLWQRQPLGQAKTITGPMQSLNRGIDLGFRDTPPQT